MLNKKATLSNFYGILKSYSNICPLGLWHSPSGRWRAAGSSDSYSIHWMSLVVEVEAIKQASLLVFEVPWLGSRTETAPHFSWAKRPHEGHVRGSKGRGETMWEFPSFNLFSAQSFHFTKTSIRDFENVKPYFYHSLEIIAFAWKIKFRDHNF